jgi:hypothetical protein
MIVVRSSNSNKNNNSDLYRNQATISQSSRVISPIERSKIEKIQRIFPVRCGGRAVVGESEEGGDEEERVHPQWNDEDYEEIIHPGIAFSTGGIGRMKMLLTESTKRKKKDSSLISTTLRVPKFWNPPEYNRGDIRSFLGDNGRRLMTQDEASLIGSHVIIDGKTSKDGRASRAATKLPTIFVAVANYRDTECQPTVVSILERATHPERIRISIVDQIDFDDYTHVDKDGNSSNNTTILKRCHQPSRPCHADPDQVLCRYQHLVDVYEVPAYLMVGPVLARHIGHRMYRGEYFAMQIDAHVRFVQDWDNDIIEQWEATNNEMAVLSTYMTDITGSIDPITHRSLRTDRNILCRVDYDGSGLQRRLTLKQPTQQKEPYPFDGSPQLHPFWSAGFSFSRGHFVLQVPVSLPNSGATFYYRTWWFAIILTILLLFHQTLCRYLQYDQHLPMIFQGEESSMMIRGFTYGYDYYAPARSVAFHIYAIKSNIDRRKRHKFWENDLLYKGALEKSTKRLNYIGGLLSARASNLRRGGDDYLHVDEDKYGVGMIRSRDTYFRVFGIHPEGGGFVDDINQLCLFVQNKMHPAFTRFLRPDGMGIDYARIELGSHSKELKV